MRKYNATEKGAEYNKQHVREWRKKNPSKSHTAYKRIHTSDSWRTIIIDFLIKRDGLICGICGQSLEGAKIQINHIIPVALNGPDTMDNVNLAHTACNVRQGVKTRALIHGH